MPVLYLPDDRPNFGRSVLYSFQWLAFNLVNVSVIPVIVGGALGLSQGGIVELAQRTAFFAALASLLQVLFGHRLPIIEGPAGMWWGVFITLAEMAPAIGKDLAVLRTNLEFGMIAAGLILIVIGFSGVLGRALKFFTPAVTGTVLILLTLQLAGPLVRGMLGISAAHPVMDPRAAVVSVVVLTIVILVNLKFTGFVSSIAVLLGTLAGWALAVPLGIAGGITEKTGPLIALPGLLSWGTPAYDPGILLVCVLTGVLVLTNSVASLIAMERTLSLQLTRQTHNRGVVFTGLGDILAGLSATVGVVPYSASAGLVGITGVGARLPFIFFAMLTMLLGCMPPVATLLSSVPAPVGNAVLLASFCQMFGFGLRDFSSLELNGRTFFVVGLPIIIGTGIFTLPPESLSAVPASVRYLLGNGFIAGMLLCVLLEHVFLPGKRCE